MINVIPRFKIQNRALSPFRSKKVPRKESENNRERILLCEIQELIFT
jgi:hypothetical protein